MYTTYTHLSKIYKLERTYYSGMKSFSISWRLRDPLWSKMGEM